jgi:spore coat protein U-like protein
MLNRTIILATTTHVPATFLDEDGNAIDMSVNSRVARLRLSARGTASVSYTLDTTDSGEFTWDDGTGVSGTGKWLFQSDDIFTAGEYDATVVYTDPAQSPDDVHLLGTAVYTFATPKTGAL